MIHYVPRASRGLSFTPIPGRRSKSRLASASVARIVYFDSRPAEMRQSEIDAIREFLSLADSRELMPGDEVEILCGAMKSITGRVRKVKKRYVLLYLEQLGATVCVDTAKVARVANKGENG